MYILLVLTAALKLYGGSLQAGVTTIDIIGRLLAAPAAGSTGVALRDVQSERDQHVLPVV